jgi:hypothetical protein
LLVEYTKRRRIIKMKMDGWIKSRGGYRQRAIFGSLSVA